MKRFFGKVDLFAPSLGDKEAIIPYSFNFDLKKNKESLKKSARPHLLQKSYGGQPKHYYWEGGGG